ncbi:calmodulin [Amia ocellicauda]|uniref:calmodulin n=1 Tax=Amia ocellicauda TaxID=2972642 RepID=UPI003464A493|nr:CALM protein [Amia calva]
MTYHLTEEQIEELRAAFNDVDEDKDGYIPREDLEPLMVALGYRFEDVDMNDDGRIDFPEFLAMLEGKVKPECQDGLRLAFNEFDLNKDGHISAVELFKVLSVMGKPITMEKAKEMIKAADTDGSGEVEYEEFIAVMKDWK